MNKARKPDIVRPIPKTLYRIVLLVCVYVIVSTVFFSKQERNENEATIITNNTMAMPMITTKETSMTDKHSNSNTIKMKFYVLDTPDMTKILHRQHRIEVEGNNSTSARKNASKTVASEYYTQNVDEEKVEMWLLKGFKQLTSRTFDPDEADAFILGGFFHLFSPGRMMMTHFNHRPKTKEKRMSLSSNSSELSWEDVVPAFYRSIIIDSTKPHLIIIPTWNPEVSQRIGLRSLVKSLRVSGVKSKDIWSVGFERNLNWQPIPYISHIVPIPYLHNSKIDIQQHKVSNKVRNNNSVFYLGDRRINAEKWSGCYRSNLTESLTYGRRTTDMIDIRLVNKKDRLNQTLYNMKMRTSDYCLILCGDTPTSRTLSSAIVEGCIPLFVGSRWNGLCESPCHKGFGFTVSGPSYPHFPYYDKIQWHIFPTIAEEEILSHYKKSSSSSSSVLEPLFLFFDDEKKQQLRDVMEEVRSGFIYGVGDPVFSENFGDATSYVWESFAAALKKK